MKRAIAVTTNVQTAARGRSATDGREVGARELMIFSK